MSVRDVEDFMARNRLESLTWNLWPDGGRSVTAFTGTVWMRGGGATMDEAMADLERAINARGRAA